MKTVFYTVCLILWSSTMLLAQQPDARPKSRKTFPSFISLPEKVNSNAKQALLQRYLEMTPDDELRSVRSWNDRVGFSHEKFKQYYKGVEVDGATFTIHASNGQITHMSGNYRDVSDVLTTAALPASAAFARAVNYVGARRYIWDDGADKPTGKLVIFSDPQGRSEPRLAYKFDIYATDPLYRAYVYIDAQNGQFIFENLRIHTTDEPATGNSLYNGNVPFTADFTGSNYRLRQTTDGNGIETFSLNNGTNYNAATDITSSSTNFTSDDAGVQAHWGAEQTHKYYIQHHGRNSYDNAGTILRSYVHYSTNYVNAFWDGQRMTYGDGDQVSYDALVALDICGHEITHGVTEYSANLIYSYESGALNESFSDIFGEAIENFAAGPNDWQIGADIGIGGSGAIRSMDEPNDFNDPDTYGGDFWYTGSGDNGGVHTNSGVQNKWFYILAVGESGTNDLGNAYNVAGIGMDKAEAIAYRNLTVYLTATSSYFDARTGAIQSAIDLYGAGSPEEIATTNAWYAVGVGGAYGTISYCTSRGNNSYYEWISQVTVGAFSNSSGAAGYTDFTSQTVNLTAGQSYNLSLTPGFSSISYNEYWKIWIDYNGDGDFSDAGELAFDAGSLSNTTVNGTLSVPSGASGATRMRVSMKYNAAQTGPCETFTYGEVEDYTVAISGGTPDTEPPSAPGDLAADNTTQTSTTLSWSASTDNVGVVGYDVYVDGGLDGSTTDLTYTVNGLTAATTYAMSVRARDAADNHSDPSAINVTTLSGGGATTLFTSYFETGWDGWDDGGKDCSRYFGTRSWEGNYSIQLRDNSGLESAMTSQAYDVSGYTELVVEFHFYTTGMNNGDDFWLRYYDGNIWTTAATFVHGTDFNSNTFYGATVTLSGAQYNFPTNAQFRFQGDANGKKGRVYIDAVIVNASNPLTLLPESTTLVRELDGELRSITEIPTIPFKRATQALLYPNPVDDLLQVRVTAPVRSMTLFSANGAVLRHFTVVDEEQTIDMSTLGAGVYFLSIQTDEEVINRKFVKQ